MSNVVQCGDVKDVLRKWVAQGVRVQTCVTSPPYWGLRNYGVAGQLGLESTPQEYAQRMVEVFRLVRDLLAEDGTLWLNLGDSYGAVGGAGLKPKNLIGIPWRIAFALQADGWYLRQDIIWHKPNPMPESVLDRCTKAHEYVFLLAKNPKYYYNADAIMEPISASFANDSRHKTGGTLRNEKEGYAAAGAQNPKGPHRLFGKGNAKTFRGGGAYTRGRSFDNSNLAARESHGNAPNETGLRNKRSVWTITTKPFKGAHFATFPPGLVEPCILAGSRPGDTVLDPFAGSGTTGMVAAQHGRHYRLIELNPEYCKLIDQRLYGDMFS